MNTPRLKFQYVNWRGEDYEYEIEPHSIVFQNPKGHRAGWYLIGRCVRRDSKPRDGFPIRSFLLADIRELEEVR
jgi:hypothetical protein